MNPEQRESFRRDGFLVVDRALDLSTVDYLNAKFEQKLQEDGCGGALAWYIDREKDHTAPNGEQLPRTLWHNDLIAPPAVEPILRELCSSYEYGHLHPSCPVSKRGHFRLDHDNAHYIAPFDPEHSVNAEVDFPAAEHHNHAPMSLWTPDGIIQDGFHGGPPLYHISVVYELQPVGPGDGGFACIAGSHLNGALIGPHKQSPLGAGHVPWGKPPWPPEVDCDVTRVEGQPGQAIIFTERLVHSTVPWRGSGSRRSLFLKYVPYGCHCEGAFPGDSL